MLLLTLLSFWLGSLQIHGFPYLWGWGNMFLSDLFFPHQKQSRKVLLFALSLGSQWWRTNSSVLKAPFTLWPQSAFTSLNELSFTAAWQLCFTWDLRERWSNFSKPCSSTKLTLNSPIVYAIDHTCFCTASCRRACCHWWGNTSQTLIAFSDTIAWEFCSPNPSKC